MMTSRIDRPSVNSTSSTAARIGTERSISVSRLTPTGRLSRILGRVFLTASTTATVLASGWRWMAMMIPRVSLRQAAVLSFSTLSMARATSCNSTGAPFFEDTTIGM